MLFPHSFFTQHGLFLKRNFLSSEFCATLREEINGNHKKKPGKIFKDDKKGNLVIDIRKVETCRLNSRSGATVKASLTALQPEIQSHFDVSLKGFEYVQYLSYHPGDFYLPHTDLDQSQDAPANMQRRKVSTLMFLNEPQPTASNPGYQGCSLVFYGLIPGSKGEKFGFPVTPEEGMLIAFPSSLWHEVTPLESGIRFAAVTWFY